ncbi:hypothetical protein [Aliikangiella sp. IMCC44359]|uniref:hypothetical protein n=1 Tax=Aliikangiella sp. IMCC44359 TaxID=3459125 RepID=UPI00403A7E35
MTQVGESVNVSTIPISDKEFKGVIISLKFTDGFKAAHNKKQITGNHWPTSLYQGKYSQKPGVYAFGSKAAQQVEITIKVESKGYSGNGALTGVGASLEFLGELPLSSGEHKVIVKLKTPPDSLAWHKGQVSWGVVLPDSCVLIGTTFIELFFVFDDPCKQDYFSTVGVWTEALRHLFNKGKVTYINKKNEAAEKVTQFCFGIPYHQYEITQGAPGFGGASGSFMLSSYISPVFKAVNCYDQTYAVIVFSGALGLTVAGIYLNPFGFLATINLVGFGRCNNPFPQRKYTSALSSGSASPSAKPEDYLLVSTDDPDRMPFGNHMFCEYSSKIYDACAGPVVGSVDKAGYVASAIDSSTSLYSLYSGFNPGTVSDMSDISAMGLSVKKVT